MIGTSETETGVKTETLEQAKHENKSENDDQQSEIKQLFIVKKGQKTQRLESAGNVRYAKQRLQLGLHTIV